MLCKVSAMTSPLERLEAVLAQIGPLAVALSGGVDSMTLAVVAGRRLGAGATMIHAVSPAVPPEASARVNAYARREGWPLEIIDAGEFADPNYLKNPANRCFFCKTNLYATIATRTQATICSGTNLDDLADWRPGLQAAAQHAVRHPYVEAEIDKTTVRALARQLELNDLAELPAAPCLSSRLETGLPVTAQRLELVHAIERLIQRELNPHTVRCRMLLDGIAIQLDPAALEEIGSARHIRLRTAINDMLARHGYAHPVRYQPYRMGSAFHRPEAHV
jgi:pyridinium-3,5-biscarboxylic acid mononucleotide sulfurtransferase